MIRSSGCRMVTKEHSCNIDVNLNKTMSSGLELSTTRIYETKTKKRVCQSLGDQSVVPQLTSCLRACFKCSQGSICYAILKNLSKKEISFGKANWPHRILKELWGQMNRVVSSLQNKQQNKKSLFEDLHLPEWNRKLTCRRMHIRKVIDRRLQAVPAAKQNGK